MKEEISDKALFNSLEYPKVLSNISSFASTSLGKEGVLAILPKTTFLSVIHSLNETDEALKILNLGATPPFGGVFDVIEFVKHASKGLMLIPEEINSIGSLLYATRRFYDFFLEHQDDLDVLNDYAKRLTVLKNLENTIEQTISREQTVKDEASNDLFKIRREIRINKNKVKEKLENILRSTQQQKYFQDQIVTMRGDRYVIPIKQEYRNMFSGIVHDQSGSGATVFIEPLSVVEINNDIKKLIAEEKEEVARILRRISKEIANNSLAILENIEVLKTLDIIFAKAKYALFLKAKKPTINKIGKVVINKGRHPLIDQKVVVPIDISFGDNIKTLIITGSNAGGKTVTLKLVGLFVLMMQSGIFLPSEYETTLPIFTSVFVDIGDEQSIEQNLSTFSGQIKNLIEIVKSAKENSLVLLDEICAGTDPKEGSALSMAILSKLKEQSATTVITTHYSELKVFAFQTDGMENASVDFDSVSLEPTYRILMGMPGSSNAFHIATRLGLDIDVVKKAEGFLDEEHKKMENVLKTLEEERKYYNEENIKLKTLSLESTILQEKLLKKEEELSDKRNEILNKSRMEAREIIRQARVDAEEAIKEIKSLHNEYDPKTRQKTIDKSRKKLIPSSFLNNDIDLSGERLTNNNAYVGKIVYVPSLRQKGTILSVHEKEVVLQMGLLKMNIPMENCFLSKDDTKVAISKKTRRRSSNAISKVMDFKSEIDVRGMTVDEARVHIDKYIDDALLANISRVLIIHGKGTGALKKGLEEYFAQNKFIKSYVMAEQNEGGSGATVLFL